MILNKLMSSIWNLWSVTLIRITKCTACVHILIDKFRKDFYKFPSENLNIWSNFTASSLHFLIEFTRHAKSTPNVSSTSYDHLVDWLWVAYKAHFGGVRLVHRFQAAPRPVQYGSLFSSTTFSYGKTGKLCLISIVYCVYTFFSYNV